MREPKRESVRITVRASIQGAPMYAARMAVERSSPRPAKLSRLAWAGRPGAPRLQHVPEIGFRCRDRCLHGRGEGGTEKLGGHLAVPKDHHVEESERFRLVAGDRGSPGREERVRDAREGGKD